MYFKTSIECAVCKGAAWRKRALCSFCNYTVTREFKKLKEDAARDEMEKYRIDLKWWQKCYKEI